MGSFETIKAEVRGKKLKERGQWKDSNQKIQARTAWGQFLNIQGETVLNRLESLLKAIAEDWEDQGHKM